MKRQIFMSPLAIITMLGHLTMSGTNKPSDEDSESVLKPQRMMPDLFRCRVRRSGLGDLVCCCSEEDFHSCEYSEHHAFDTFCFHPQCREILARSEGVR
jgi:hypothetical protein